MDFIFWNTLGKCRHLYNRKKCTRHFFYSIVPKNPNYRAYAMMIKYDSIPNLYGWIVKVYHFCPSHIFYRFEYSFENLRKT